MVAILEGPLPDFNEAFTQLHLGQLLASVKCFSGDRRDGGIDPNADHIPWDSSSSLPRVDEDLGIGIAARHAAKQPWDKQLIRVREVVNGGRPFLDLFQFISFTFLPNPSPTPFIIDNVWLLHRNW
jgi:hypothetical protein